MFNAFPRFCFIACFQYSVFVPSKLLSINYPLFHCQFSFFLLDLMFSSDIHRAEKECPGNVITFSWSVLYPLIYLILNVSCKMEDFLRCRLLFCLICGSTCRRNLVYRMHIRNKTTSEVKPTLKGNWICEVTRSVLCF